MIARLRGSLSPGDVVAGIPLMAYIWLGIFGEHLVDAPRFVIFIAILLSVSAVGYGALLVALDDLMSWRRSPELNRWLARAGVLSIGCLLFAGDLAGAWKWISD